MVNLVNLEVERERHVVADKLELWMQQEMRHIRFRARIEIVDAKNLVSALEQAVAQVRADEACSTSDDNAFRLLDHLATLPSCHG